MGEEVSLKSPGAAGRRGFVAGADVGVGIDQAGGDPAALGVDDLGRFGHRDIFPDPDDFSLVNENDPVFQDALGDGDQFAAGDSQHDAFPLSLLPLF